MILIGAFSMVVVFGMPYLIENSKFNSFPSLQFFPYWLPASPAFLSTVYNK